MALYEEHNQLDYRLGGDTIDDFAQKHMAEITRIFRFLNDLKTNSINGVEYTEPSAGQFKVEDDKIYIRNSTNDEWLLLGKVAKNFGFENVTTAALGGKPLDVAVLGDGQILVYRASDDSWHNENKSAVGAGKSLLLYNGEDLIADYSGSNTTSVDLSEVIGGGGGGGQATYFYTDGVYTVPKGVSVVYISGCAGGASGTRYAGGGGGESVYRQAIAVTAGQKIPVTIGAGGTAYIDTGASVTAGGQDGGNTTFGDLLTLTGGLAGPDTSSMVISFTPGRAGGRGATDGKMANMFNYTSSSAYIRAGGAGGDTLFGRGGNGGYVQLTDSVGIGENIPAKAGIGYGSGGGSRGEARANSSNVAFSAAGNGANGLLIIETA